MTQKNIYFASDFHLGYPVGDESRQREQRIVRWLDSIKHDAAHIYLLGDLFDFWYEYKYAVPKGFIRFQAKLMELREMGIPITIFTGNHDLWMFGYFEEEFGIPVIDNPISLIINGKHFHIGHGDGLGPGDYHYKFLKKIFTSKICQFLYSQLPVSIALGFGFLWSDYRKKKNAHRVEVFLNEKEWIWTYCKEVEAMTSHDFYIFGHRHLPLDLPVGTNGGRYINLGEWFGYDTYAVFDGTTVHLKKYTAENPFSDFIAMNLR